MLHRIESIEGLGLLHEARGAAYQLESRALVYAGNGRGKSTLASILRSCATGETHDLQERATIDGINDARVVLHFDAGHKVTFEKDAWTEQRGEIIVFDAEFINRNVHSGTEITSEHRKNLLDFAIGDHAVQAKVKEEAESAKQKKATEKIRQLSSQLQAYADGSSLSVFRSIKPIENAKENRAKIEDRLSATLRIDSIRQQPLPAPFEIPSVDIEHVFSILDRTLEDVHLDAEAAVNAHVNSNGDPALKDWIRQGQAFDDHSTCPYCGQDTQEVSLIRMYQSFFNAAYGELVASVDQLTQVVDSFTHVDKWNNFLRWRASNGERAERWSQYTEITYPDSSRDELAKASLENLRDLLAGLVSRKSLSITEAVGTAEELTESLRLWDQVRQIMLDANALVEDAIGKISVYKESLESEDSARIRSDLQALDLAVVRHTEPVVQLLDELVEAETDLKDAEKAKKAARELLTEIMTQTLRKYRENINLHLFNLGAQFTIDEIKTNYLGGSPRTEYGIRLRGKPVKLSGGTPTFFTALSEGDKRTMAFAFFIASTLEDPQLNEKIVVVDDPMSSLDKARREYTTELLVSMADRCGQLIILAHDAVYLRDLRNAFRRQDKLKSVSTMQISRVSKSYSNFDSIDLDRECESAYYTHYRTVDEFVSGTSKDERAAAVALRPLLEGYLHRRYPGSIPADVMLGKAIDVIEKAPADSPLISALNGVPEMRKLNTFAGRFHHDTNPDFASVRTDAQAVATYGERVLNLIHGVS